MSSEPTRHCLHVNDDGSRCKAHPLVGRAYCFFHDPAMKKKRAAAGRDGGLMRGQRALAALRLPPGMFTAPLETASDVAALIRETTERFCRGELDMRLASTVTYMSNSLLHAWSRASQEDASPALADDPALSPNDECDAGPDDEESVLALLQRGLVEARVLEEQIEAQRLEAQMKEKS